MTETEQLLTEVAAGLPDYGFRTGLADLYAAGAFGARDFVKAYAWTLAAWDEAPIGYDHMTRISPELPTIRRRS